MEFKTLKGFLKEENINKDSKIDLLSVIINQSSAQSYMLLYLLDEVFVRWCFDQ